MLRQPIVCVLGHVDHGKTSLLDAIRHTKVQSREAGAITQHIGASEVPRDAIEAACGPLLQKMKVNLTLPGLLFIDTPGHEAFVNLRKRGGSIADIAILVIDVNQGLQPQTREAIEILREYKTPFLIAATKVDAMSGWRPQKNASMAESIVAQRQDVQDQLDKRVYEMVGALAEFGFESERFDRVTDFLRTLAIVPVSARTGEGLPEVLVFVSGLAQRFLEKQLRSVEGKAKASILEIKEEKGVGMTLDAIVYEGTLHEGDLVAFLNPEGKVLQSHVKAILRPKPLDEMRDPRHKFTSVKEARAAVGVKIVCDEAGNAVPGSSLFAYEEREFGSVEEMLKKEVQAIAFEKAEKGVMVKADALGSLEAIVRLLQAEKVPVRKAAIGNVLKKEIVEAGSVAKEDYLLGVIFAFNTPVEEEAHVLAEKEGVKVFEEKVIYNLIENYKRWKAEKVEGDRKDAFSRVPLPAKIYLLEKHCFRVSNPCIFGVEVLGGRIRKGTRLMDEKGESIGEIKAIQADKKTVEEAKKGQQVAISVDGPYYGRQVREKMILLTEIEREPAKMLEEKYSKALSDEEKDLLQEIKRIKGFVSHAF